MKDDLEFFEEINTQEYFDWKNVIFERFNFDEYERTLLSLT